MNTPCYGKHELFDAMDAFSHQEAKALCNTCPFILECARNLADTKRTGGLYGQPEGTWAGQLHMPLADSGRNREYHRRAAARQVAEEDAKYTDDQARIASTDYKAGIRTEWNQVGHRVHQRRRKRAQREKGAA